MAITYARAADVTADAYIAVLNASTLGDRRPVRDRDCIAGMIAHADLLVSAWDGAQLVGVARSLTDFHYDCFLSDLAVDAAYQGQGIGRTLQAVTVAELGPSCKLVLLAAPAADGYYAHIGLTRHPRCWVLEAGDKAAAFQAPG